MAGFQEGVQRERLTAGLPLQPTVIPPPPLNLEHAYDPGVPGAPHTGLARQSGSEHQRKVPMGHEEVDRQMAGQPPPREWGDPCVSSPVGGVFCVFEFCSTDLHLPARTTQRPHSPALRLDNLLGPCCPQPGGWGRPHRIYLQMTDGWGSVLLFFHPQLGGFVPRFVPLLISGWPQLSQVSYPQTAASRDRKGDDICSRVFKE